MSLTTLPKAARASGVPYDTLLRLVHEKKVRAVKIAGRRSYLIEPADLQAFIEASKTVGTTPGTTEPRELPKTEVNRAPKNGARRMKTPVDIGERPWYEKYS